MLYNVASYHCMQFQEKRFFSNFAHLAEIRAAIFFPKNLAFSDTWYHDQLSSCTISEKTNDPVLKTLSDWRTYGQTGEKGFIGRCPTNVERPIEKCLTKNEAARFQLGRVNHLRNFSSSARLWLCFRFVLTKSCNMRLKAVGNST